MKTWMLAALVAGFLAIPFEDALARGGGGRRGGFTGGGPRASRRTTKKNEKKLVERLQEQNRDAVLADALRDRA